MKETKNIIKKTEITEFALRHFDKSFGGTKILDRTPGQFMGELHDVATLEYIDGYADFCRLVPVVNFTNAATGVLPITVENYQYLRSGYGSRTSDELPVLSRWLELPTPKPVASHLMLVLYSKAQLDSEALENNSESYVGLGADWGIVAILGQMTASEEPMKPMTMLRNALGKGEGGSGVELDREKYKKAVDFWSKNATVK